jgi:hypothetical protein
MPPERGPAARGRRMKMPERGTRTAVYDPSFERGSPASSSPPVSRERGLHRR